MRKDLCGPRLVNRKTMFTIWPGGADNWETGDNSSMTSDKLDISDPENPGMSGGGKTKKNWSFKFLFVVVLH